MEVRTRIAPSPTGFLHIGTARAALFNYLAARRYDGVFLIRFEDTDPARSKKEFEKNILEGLLWLGMKPDEEPVRQSERGVLYRKYLEKLLEEGKAFYCTHTKEYLETERKEQMARKEAPRHVCSNRDEKKDTGIIRLKNNERGAVIVPDIIRGDIPFEAENLGDFAIARSLDSALFHFAVVVDDFEMKITHVTRGEDHISNTPKHILIQQAIGAPLPVYAHLPLVLGSDRSKLSKRHGSTSIDEYRKQGYLPEAIVNFIALLGWHPPSKIIDGKRVDQEIFTREELVKEFSWERIQKGGAIFDIEKLDWVNREHLKAKNPDELTALLQDYLNPAWISS
ncbi:MAG: glutamate--tRNA ligase, partial [Patescibacteria group bacterium]